MQNTIAIISLIIYAALLAIIFGLRCRYKKVIRKKNEGLFRYIDREREMKEAIKRERIEKETLMKVIKQLRIK